MERQPNHIDRKMIPRWRSLAKTPSSELLSSSAGSARATIRVSGVTELEAEWQVEPSLEVAGELLASYPLAGRTDFTDAATELIIGAGDRVAPGLRRLVTRYRQPENSDGLEQISSTWVRRQQISALRRHLSVYAVNPILHVDMARLYVSLGQSDQARSSFRKALSQAPRSRFVLRSAARFFVHSDDPDAAWQVIRDAPSSDPWIAACKIAVADLTGRPQLDIRSARRLIDNLHPSQITELAAALATLELKTGANKKAKKLIYRSAERPTDNTVAQLRWANESLGTPFEAQWLQTELSYEARTGQAQRDKDWFAAVDHALDWLNDEPFSVRPAAIGCYIAAEILQDYNRAIEISNLGLICNPNDATLLNNRAFARANAGDLDNAWVDLMFAKSLTADEEERTYLTATEGCLRYRSGDLIGGSNMYSSALDQAVKNRDASSAQRVAIHWIYEEGLSGHGIGKESAEFLRKFFADQKNTDDELKEIYKVYAEPILDMAAGLPESESIAGIQRKILALDSPD